MRDSQHPKDPSLDSNIWCYIALSAWQNTYGMSILYIYEMEGKCHWWRCNPEQEIYESLPAPVLDRLVWAILALPIFPKRGILQTISPSTQHTNEFLRHLRAQYFTLIEQWIVLS